MRGNLERWLDLSGEERRLLACLALLLPAIGMTLRLIGLRQTRRLLLRTTGAASPQAPATAGATASASRLARLVDIASRHGPYRATCLRQSLALWWLLRRRGVAAELRIGVSKPEGRMSAHAWVEVGDVAVDGETSIGRVYSAFPDLGQRLPV